MKEKHYYRWENIRQKGFLKYIIQFGIFAFGLPLFIFTSFLNKTFENGFNLKNVTFNLSIWLIAGITFSILMWHLMESRFDRELTKRKYSDS